MLIVVGREGWNMFQHKSTLPTKEFLYKPTLITDLYPAASTVQEEIFGTVLVSLTFRTPEEAIALANNTRYGLGGGMWSDNINIALDAASNASWRIQESRARFSEATCST